MTFLTHLEESTVQRFAEGALPAAERSAAEAHLEHCGHCRRRVSDLSRVAGALASVRSAALLPEPPADFAARVMARVALEPAFVPSALEAARDRGPSPVERFRARDALPALLAGVAAIVCGVALVTVGGGALPLAGEAARSVTTLAHAAGRLGLALTVLRAALPVLAAAAVASLVVLWPLLAKALTLPPRPARRAARIGSRGR